MPALLVLKNALLAQGLEIRRLRRKDRLVETLGLIEISELMQLQRALQRRGRAWRIVANWRPLFHGDDLNDVNRNPFDSALIARSGGAHHLEPSKLSPGLRAPKTAAKPSR
ncbi:MAG: hypothetical protein ACLPGW_17395 [Roseiarcus sp.]